MTIERSLCIGISAVAMSAASAAPAAASMQDAAPDRPASAAMRVNLPLLLGQTFLGDISAEVGQNNDVSLNYEDFVRLMGERLKPEHKAKLTAIVGNGLISAASLKQAGIEVAYNPETLEISASIPLTEQGSRALRIVTAADLESRSYDSSSRFSASSTLNLSQTISHSGSLFGDLEPVRIANQTAFNMGGDRGVNLFVEAQYDGSERIRLKRGPITLTHENRNNAMRYLGGDVSPTVSGFQAGQPLGGIGIEKSYSELQPYRNVRPAGLFKFALEENATVEVLVNGAPARAFRLERGQYDIRDFNFASGLNQIKIYVVDDYGRRLIASFSQFFNFNLLDPGISEFGAYVGFPQTRNGSGVLTYSGSPTFTGYYRRGLTQSLTGGIDLQANSDQIMGGISAGFASKLGTFAIAAAASRDREAGLGHQLLVNYQLSGEGFWVVDAPSFDLELRNKSKNFIALGDLPGADLTRFEIRSRVSGTIGNRFGIGLFGLSTMRRDNRATIYSYGASLSTSFAGFSISANLERTRTDEGRGSRFFLSFGRSLGGRQTSRSSYDSRTGTAQLELSRYRDISLSDFGYRAGLSRGRGGYVGVGELTYNSNRAFFSLRHDAITDRSGGDIANRSSYSVSTQLAFAGGRLAVGRPVGYNFLLAYPHRTLPSDVLVTQGIEDEKIIAKSGLLGPALAPAGTAHSPRRVTLRAEELPDGYDAGKSHYELLPGSATGYVAQVGSDENRTIQGNLIGADGSAIDLAVGSVEWLDKPTKPKTQIFTNKAGRFVVTGLAPGRYRVRIGEDGLLAEIAVPKTEGGVVEVGRLVVKAESK